MSFLNLYNFKLIISTIVYLGTLTYLITTLQDNTLSANVVLRHRFLDRGIENMTNRIFTGHCDVDAATPRVCIIGETFELAVGLSVHLIETKIALSRKIALTSVTQLIN